MPNSTASSSASDGCRPDANGAQPVRIAWRPSRYVLTALALLTLFAVIALWASELPAMVAWPLGLLVVAHGVRCLRREAARPPFELVLRSDGVAFVDGARIEALQVAWRGPLAFARWRGREGRWQRHAWWPDTLPPARRRELRLAASEGPSATGGASVAP
jgi:toxin CptA